MAGSGRGLPDRIFYGGAVAFLALLIFVVRAEVGLIHGFELLLGGALLIGTIAVVAWVAWYLLNRPTTPTALELSRRFEAVRFMDGAQFEVFVADLLRTMGHRALVCGGVGDQGVDIVVDPRGRRIAVQCKNYAKPVGNRSVQEVYAGTRHHRCVEAWVVAPAGYTGGAIDLAQSTGVSLHDADSIRRWIKRVDELEMERAGETRQEIGHPAPADTPTNTEPEHSRKRAVWHPHPDDPPGPRGSSQRG